MLSIAFLIVLVSVASCLKLDIVTLQPEEVQVSISFKSSDISQTRADESIPGDDNYNENKINTLDIFFYPSDATEKTEAVHHIQVSNLANNGSYTYKQRIGADDIQKIFGTTESEEKSAKIYAIANFRSDDEGVTLSSTASVNDLKSLVIATESFATTAVQKNFVMDSAGDDVVTYKSKTGTITSSESIKLYRSASKITLSISQVNKVNVTDEYGNNVMWDHDTDATTPEIPVMWVADTESITARFIDGVTKGCIDGYVGNDEIVYYQTPVESPVKMKKGSDSSSWEHEYPFYSYVSDWSTENRNNEAYIYLVVPWQKSDAPGVYHNTYYKVPISKLNKLERNKYYKINLIVSRLGAFDEGDNVVLTPASYYILDWTTNTIATELLNYRYLVVDQKEYTIYNQDELYIPFSSSHETEIVDVTFEQQNINVFSKEPSWTTIQPTNSNYYNNLEILGNQIYFKNILDNVYTSETFDFTPYRIRFTICHTDEYADKYYENITIMQYPAIYGQFKQNTDYSNDKDDNGNHGYVFVNGYYYDNEGSSSSDASGLGSQDWFCSAPGLVNDNASPNMYLFNITSVHGTDYVIGDPRTAEIDYNLVNAKRTHINANNSATAWVQAPALYDNASNRGLKYYYPTDVDYKSATTMENSRTRHMIAPQFRIASSYGVLHTGANNASASLEGMRKRCASYQEDGYPAGRWRLPTEAEFMFIIKQVNRDPAALPQLYIHGNSYWCAHGLGKVDGTEVEMSYQQTSGGNSTRCVYDTWYWGDDRLSDPNVFTWGDMPR
jgi:hypothetical protein